MDPLRLHTVAARVVAWHNRHPLARRITVAQVQSVGYVALPYTTTVQGAVAIEPPLDDTPASAASAASAAPAAPMDALAQLRTTMAESGSSLRERAMARAKVQGEAPAPVAAAPAAARPNPGPPPDASLHAAFSEDFIAPLQPREVARWAARHGRPMPQLPTDAPLREVPGRGTDPGQQALTLVVLTAAVEVGDLRHRVLLGVGDSQAVLGRRFYSRARTAGLSLGVLVSVGGAGIALRPPAFLLPALSIPTLAEAQKAAPPLAAAPAASAPPGDLPALETSAPSTPPSPPATAPADLSVEPASTPDDDRPLDVEPRLGRVELPSLRLPISNEAKEAARQERLARNAAATAASSPAGTLPETVSSVTASPALASAATVANRGSASALWAGKSFAVSTRPLRTRAEADQVREAMDYLLRDRSGVQVEVLPQGEDWRVVGWPFEQRDAAEKARGLLVARGMRVEVVGF